MDYESKCIFNGSKFDGETKIEHLILHKSPFSNWKFIIPEELLCLLPAISQFALFIFFFNFSCNSFYFHTATDNGILKETGEVFTEYQFSNNAMKFVQRILFGM